MRTIRRHDFAGPFVHWLVALSTFALTFSGFGQMPMYKRYLLDRLPGLGWSSDYSVTLLIHYFAALSLIFAVAFHLLYHGLRGELALLAPRRGDLAESKQIMKALFTGGPEPASHKYLAEQRLSYGLTGFSLVLVILTGLVKVVKNLPGVALPHGLILGATALHNIGTFLVLASVFAHLGAFLFKANRKLLPAIFNGQVDEEYARHRHSLWYQSLGRSAEAAQPPGVDGQN